jgi:hypothetical protein
VSTHRFLEPVDVGGVAGVEPEPAGGERFEARVVPRDLRVEGFGEFERGGGGGGFPAGEDEEDGEPDEERDDAEDEEDAPFADESE